MSANTSLRSAMEVVTDGAAPNLVIDNFDEFTAGIFACATSADYAIGSF